MNDMNIINNPKGSSGVLRRGAFYAGIALMIALTLFTLVKIAESLKEFSFIGKGTYPATTMNFSGSGDVYAAPDIATLSFTVTKQDKDLKTAQDYVSTKVDSALGAVKNDGVAEKDLKTISYTIQPKYDYVYVDDYSCVGCKKSNRVFSGYEVSQSVQVKVRDLENAGKVIEDLGTAKVTNIGSISFDIENKDALMAQAREKAIADARSKAQQLSKDLDVDLVRIVSFNEYGGGVYADTKAYGMGGLEATSSIAPSVSVPTGENKISVNVNITYEIE